MENNLKEKRNYRGKKNSDIVNFPVSLRKNLLSPVVDSKVLDMPLSGYRIIFKILNDISNEQFRSENKNQVKQLNLFEQDFKTEHNTYARFTFKVSDVSKNKDYSNIKRGLEFLENYQKGWYKAVNNQGKSIKSYGGLISNANISDGEISFLVSAYWLEKLLKIPLYNQAYFETPWILSKSKHILFYLWLLEVPDKGTRFDFNKFQETYQYSYTTTKDFAKYVLKVIKEKLDRSSNKSFNYSVKGQLINIMPYYTKEVDLKLKEETISKQKITQKLHYWKTRHKLSKNDIDVLKSIINIDNSAFNWFLKAYDEIIKSNRGKQKVTDYEGESFVELFQQSIIKVYENSAWKNIDPKGYPKIL